jgi:hypothetical protein
VASQSVSTAEKVILEVLTHAEALALINLQDLVELWVLFHLDVLLVVRVLDITIPR